MAQFQFGKAHRPDDDTGLIDSLIDMAGGIPLPGKWGVAQALLEIWTSPFPESGIALRPLHIGLWSAKNALNTAGLYREYRRSTDPTYTQKVADPVAEFLKAKGVACPSALRDMAHFIHVYTSSWPREDATVGKSSALIRKITTPNGIVFYYVFRSGQAEADGHFWGEGPYIAPQIEDAFLADVSKAVWEKEGNADLQLSYVHESHKWSFSLTNIGAPDDYVSDGADTNWSSLTKLANRCKAFRDKGLSRKIMFHGPPGCGKTTLARSLARTIGSGHTLRIEASAVEQAGANAVMAFVRILGPKVILFDDLDRCQETTEEILHYMERSSNTKDNVINSLIVIGTANAVDTIDPALLRPGRFDEVVYVKEPCDEHRAAIVRHYATRLGLLDVMTLGDITDQTKGFSPADIRELLTCMATVGMEHLDSELERIRRQRVLFSGDKVARFLDRKLRIFADDDEDDDEIMEPMDGSEF